MAIDTGKLQEQFDRDREFFREVAQRKHGRGVVVETLRRSFATGAQGAIVPITTLQEQIRPTFGKPGVKLPTFGAHPDYAHLKSTSLTEHGAITTLFLDVANSTRLGLHYPLEAVYLVKNAILCAAIAIVNAFDGHVHRLMGDAVMAFFGGKLRRPEDGAIDALNCAAVLRYYIETVVSPQLRGDGGIDDGIGIRIGLDHGPADRVLWSTYGYPGNEEVTATSFYVDVASKLQRAAGRNEIMIGQKLRELLDFPVELLSDKTVKEAGEHKSIPYVTPNYTLPDKSPHNYRQHVLRWDDYLTTTGVAPFDPGRFGRKGTQQGDFGVTITLHAQENGPQEAEYAPSSMLLPKEKQLRFAVRNHSPWIKGAIATFEIENHGEQARAANDLTFSKLAPIGGGGAVAIHWNATRYRGLHYMTISVRNAATSGNDILFWRRCGIYIA